MKKTTIVPTRRPRLTTFERTVLRRIRSARPDLLLPYVPNRPVVNIDGVWVACVDEVTREEASVYLKAAYDASLRHCLGWRVPVVIYRTIYSSTITVLTKAATNKFNQECVGNGYRYAHITIDVSLPDFLKLMPFTSADSHEFHLEGETGSVSAQE